MLGKPGLSVVIITKNEAGRLPTCLASVAFADEIIVIDSGSTDGTVDLAKQWGARVLVTTDWPGFGLQKQRGLDMATHDWVLTIDADEWLDDQLALAVTKAVKDVGDTSDHASYEVKRISAFCGQWMHHGSWGNDFAVRLFKRGSAKFSSDLVHERLISNSKPLRLQGALLHNSITSVHDGLDKLNRYTTGRALDQHQSGKRGGLGKAVTHGMWAFVRSYFIRRGILDGRLGFALAVLDAHNSYYRYVKLWLIDRDADQHHLPPPGSGA